MIYFIGAGPGAVDLITVRGQRLLQKADMVIYAGSLVNRELLNYCRKDCKILDSAKLTLDEVIDAFVSADGEDKIIVRLHTGDPSIYGAIREQMDMLDSRGLKYDVVPGVSSLNAAAAALKAEYTLPGVSQTVIVTRMAGRTAVPAGESIRSLAAHQATMIMFLSAGMLARLCAELIAGGYSPDTPAAMVYKASWPEQAVVRGTLATLPELGRAYNQTALVLVGDFLGDEYLKSRLYAPDFSHGYREAKV